jgi:hypothetical protein
MQDMIDSLATSIEQQNWYAALCASLTFPDVCGAITAPNTRGRSRYIQWFRDNVEPKYTSANGASVDPSLPVAREIFRTIQQANPTAKLVGNRIVSTSLTAEDCYAMRCAYLHSGENDLTGQSARRILSRINFTVPTKNFKGSGNISFNAGDNVLQLSIDIFAQNMKESVDHWWNSLDSSQRATADANLLKILPFSPTTMFG